MKISKMLACSSQINFIVKQTKLFLVKIDLKLQITVLELKENPCRATVHVVTITGNL